MSFVGPRPLLVEYLPRYNLEQRRRHEVRPGLTGLAQVNGRNAICWEDRFRLDVEYVDTLSFRGDGQIIFLPLMKVFAREGINSDTAATAEPFVGTTELNKESLRPDALTIRRETGRRRLITR